MALDQAGDVASNSYDHEKAAVHYALALLNGQTFSKPILRKWVNAKLTNNNSWRDVLRTALEVGVFYSTHYHSLPTMTKVYHLEARNLPGYMRGPRELW